MEGIFLEFENENALRAYPFAAGCVPPVRAEGISAGVFVDAALYPVNPSGPLYLSSVSADGVFSVSDSSGVIMTGTVTGSEVRFRDVSGLSRHVGTLVASSDDALAEFAGRGALREYSQNETAFASSCVFPVVVDGVTSVDIAGTGMVAGMAGFANGSGDIVRASSAKRGDGRDTLRFDVIPQIGASWRSIRRVICVVDGQTPFRISKLYSPESEEDGGYNTVVLTMQSAESEASSFSIDKEVICTSAHRENDYEMADTCSCEQTTSEPVPIPETYQIEEVFIPPDPDGSEGGLKNGADNAFYLVVPNFLGYVNPLSITLEDGVTMPKTSEPEVVVDGRSADIADGELIDEVSSKGVLLQVPGLSGGLI